MSKSLQSKYTPPRYGDDDWKTIFCLSGFCNFSGAFAAKLPGYVMTS